MKYTYLYSVSKRKKITVLFLLLVITFPGQVASACTFVPKFIAHYQHHNQAHHQTDLTGFILEHLSDHKHHDSNTDHHDDCPLTQKHLVVQLVYILKNSPRDFFYRFMCPNPAKKPSYRLTTLLIPSTVEASGNHPK